MRVLVVEDDEKMAGLLRRGLAEDGLVADIATTGGDALRMCEDRDYDAILLDLMLPDIDGVDVCRRLREDGRWAPVLMVTARGEPEDRVAGLDAGADDYLAKPFSFAELLARLRALARRSPRARPAVLEVGDLTLDPATHEVRRGGVDIALSAKEYALLLTLMHRPGEVLSRRELLDRCWQGGGENRSNIVDVYIGYLRDKIDRPFGRESIDTVRGAGYRLRSSGGPDEP
jgi:two-component system OmpR family response regulator